MKENTYLKSAILEVVENQLQADDPPETRQTFEPFNPERYAKALNQLPKLPWD